MGYARGDVVLVPFPFTDLSAAKTRPAIVVSSDIYHEVRSELLLAYVSSQMTKAHPVLDYVLLDWSSSGLPKPSFVRPKLAAVEQKLIVLQVGKLSLRDLFEVDRRLRTAMRLLGSALADFIDGVDLMTQPPGLVQALAEKSLNAATKLAAARITGIDIERLRALLPAQQSPS